MFSLIKKKEKSSQPPCTQVAQAPHYNRYFDIFGLRHAFLSEAFPNHPALQLIIFILFHPVFASHDS